MGLSSGRQVVFKMNNVVARELDIILDTTLPPTDRQNTTANKRRVNCDVSNIIHLLSFKHSRTFSTALVNDVALFLKELAADTGYVVTAVLDGDVRPQSKRDAFKRRFDSTMGRINSYYSRQSAMKLSSISEKTAAEKEKLVKFNKAAKKLESLSRLQVPTNLLQQLQTALSNISAHEYNTESGGYVSSDIIKAEFEADYMIAYRFKNSLSHLIYSIDSDMTALCGPTCISIRSFVKNKKRKSNNEDQSYYIYELTGSSNEMMEKNKSKLAATHT